MKAHILPLKGKYYGTEISIIYEDKRNEVVKIWIKGNNWRPSERESILENETNDDHYESQGCLDIAKLLVKAICDHDQIV